MVRPSLIFTGLNQAALQKKYRGHLHLLQVRAGVHDVVDWSAEPSTGSDPVRSSSKQSAAFAHQLVETTRSQVEVARRRRTARSMVPLRKDFACEDGVEPTLVRAMAKHGGKHGKGRRGT